MILASTRSRVCGDYRIYFGFLILMFLVFFGGGGIEAGTGRGGEGRV